jgi:hypothetical protein
MKLMLAVQTRQIFLASGFYLGRTGWRDEVGLNGIEPSAVNSLKKNLFGFRVGVHISMT